MRPWLVGWIILLVADNVGAQAGAILDDSHADSDAPAAGQPDALETLAGPLIQRSLKLFEKTGRTPPKALKKDPAIISPGFIQPRPPESSMPVAPPPVLNQPTIGGLPAPTTPGSVNGPRAASPPSLMAGPSAPTAPAIATAPAAATAPGISGPSEVTMQAPRAFAPMPVPTPPRKADEKRKR